jgi:hypothetical protein
LTSQGRVDGLGGQVRHLARLDPALEQLGAGGVDVRHDDLDVLERAGAICVTPLPMAIEHADPA